MPSNTLDKTRQPEIIHLFVSINSSEIFIHFLDMKSKILKFQDMIENFVLFVLNNTIQLHKDKPIRVVTSQSIQYIHEYLPNAQKLETIKKIQTQKYSKIDYSSK